MKIEYKGTKVNFITYGKAKSYVLMLHGWADNGSSMKYFCDKLTDKKKYIIIDFPPFGESSKLHSDFTISDYAYICIEILKKLKIKKVDIISHSFGGRVAIYLANYYTSYVNKLLFIDSAGLKSRNRWLVKLKVFLYKLQKLFKAKKQIKGSSDYEALPVEMRKTFSNVVNYFQESQAKNIKKETLIIWGSKDKSTPLYMGKKLNRLIKNSSLIVFKDCGHFPHYDNVYKFTLIANSFLRE